MKRFLIALLLGTASVVLVNPVPSWGEDPNVVNWGTIIGLAAPGSAVGGFLPFAGPSGITPWVAEGGKAWVHLQTGQIKFSVKRLVLANSTPLAVAGTKGVTTEVKGTLVCDGLSGASTAFVDTPAVPFSPQGDAEFVGAVSIPTACLVTPERLAFLVRVASVNNNDAAIQINRWIAVGGVRTP